MLFRSDWLDKKGLGFLTESEEDDARCDVISEDMLVFMKKGDGQCTDSRDR